MNDEELDIWFNGNIFDIAKDDYEIIEDENGNKVVVIKDSTEK